MQNFRKIREKKVDIEYSLPLDLMIPQSYKDCYEIVNSLINDAFQQIIIIRVSIIEPQVKFYWNIEAEPRENLFETDIKGIEAYKEKKKKEKEGKGNNNISIPKFKKKKIENTNNIQNNNIIRQPQSFNVRSRQDYLANDDSLSHNNTDKTLKVNIGNDNKNIDSSNNINENKNLDNNNNVDDRKATNRSSSKKLDISKAGSIDQIPKKRIEINNNPQKDIKEDSQIENKKIENEAEEEGKGEDENNEEEQIDDDNVKTIKLNEDRINKMDLEIRRVKVLEEMKLRDKMRQEEDRKRQESIKKKEEKDRERQDMMKRMVKQRKEEMAREIQKQKEKERQDLEQREKIKRERSQQFLKQKKKELKEQFDKELEQRQKKSTEIKDKLQKEKQKADKLKGIIESGFKNDREKMIREQQRNEKIISILNSPTTKASLNSVDMQLKYIFNHYCELYKDPSYIQSKMQNKNDILHYRNFVAFANQFNMVPTIIKLPEIKVMYRSCTRHKSLDDDTPIGLDYKLFNEMLLRMSIKKQSFFFDITNQRLNNQEKDRSKSNDKASIDILDNSVTDFSVVKGYEDSYVDIDKYTPDVFDGLLIFLEIPKDKNSLVNKLNSLRKENRRTVSQRERVMEIRRKYGLDKRNENNTIRGDSAQYNSKISNESPDDNNDKGDDKKDKDVNKKKDKKRDSQKKVLNEKKEKQKDNQKENEEVKKKKDGKKKAEKEDSERKEEEENGAQGEEEIIDDEDNNDEDKNDYEEEEINDE